MLEIKINEAENAARILVIGVGDADLVNVRVLFKKGHEVHGKLSAPEYAYSYSFVHIISLRFL